MNFYDFHIGDYASRTAHLEPMEDLAYRRMLDLYYVREEPLPWDVAEIARLIRLRGQEGVIEAVLKEFFMPSEGEGWLHSKCESVIAKASDKKGKAKASADKRWAEERERERIAAEEMRALCEGNANALQPHSEGNAPSPSPSPSPKRNTPRPPRGEPEGFEEFYGAYPRKEARGKAAKAFAKVSAPLSDLLTAIAWQRTQEGWTKDGGKWIPLPASWLNDQRWKDERKTRSVTVPGRDAPDAALQKIEADRQRAAPLPAAVREQMNALTRKMTGKEPA